MSLSLAEKMKQLSFESNEEILNEAIEQAKEQEEEGMETVSDMVEHAVKAEVVAEQLEVLAEKAEEVADEDKEYLLNEVSNEAFAMVFSNIMASNNLNMQATSFESAHTNSEKMKGLAADARAVSTQVRGLEAQLLDFSPEGKINSFLRRDKAKINKAMTELKGLELRKDDLEALDGEGIRVGEISTTKFFHRADKPAKELAKEISHDVKLMLETTKQVEDTLTKVLSDVKAGKSLEDFPVTKFSIVNQPLLGNRSLGMGTYDGHVAGDLGQQLKTGTWIGLKALVIGAVTGAVTGNPVVFLLTAGASAGMMASKASNKVETTIVSIDGINQTVGELQKLTNTLDKSRTEKLLEEISVAIKERKGDTEGEAVSKKAVKDILAACAKVQDAAYEHSFFLLTRTAAMLKAAKV